MYCREEGHLPPPPPSLLLSSASAPSLTKDARRRRQPPRRSTPRPGRQAPLVPCPRPPGSAKAPTRGSRGLPPHFPRSRWISSSSGSNRPGGCLGKKSSDGRQAPPQSLLRSRACPAPDPKTCGARLPNAPLPEAGAEAVSAVPQSPPPPLQPSAAAAPRWGSGRGGWVEDAIPY